MLATNRCTPHELGLVVVELQSVGLHPAGESVDTVRDCGEERVDMRWRARAIYLCVVGVEVWQYWTNH